MPKLVRDKLAVLSGKRNILVAAPSGAREVLGLPEETFASRLNGQFDYIHFFAADAAKLRARLPVLKRHLRADGKLWVSWPKMGGLGTDLNLKEVIRLAYDAGLVESKTISFDDTWSAIKLTHPKPGKIYRNSFGRLPTDPA